MPSTAPRCAPYAPKLQAHAVQTSPTKEVDPSLVTISEKNDPPRSCTVGTTNARSRKSFCCSQLVSEISKQPRHAPPVKNRRSCRLAASCCAHTGSFEHNIPKSNAALTVSCILRPTCTNPPRVTSASEVPV